MGAWNALALELLTRPPPPPPAPPPTADSASDESDSVLITQVRGDGNQASSEIMILETLPAQV
jgi:hypothetical protein